MVGDVTGTSRWHQPGNRWARNCPTRRNAKWGKHFVHGPGAIRTRDLLLRRQALYPAELRTPIRRCIICPDPSFGATGPPGAGSYAATSVGLGSSTPHLPAPPVPLPRSPMIHDNILSTIGNTPIVRINHLAPAHVTMYVKCEAFNPMGSVKDRLAIGIIEDAERRGDLKPGQTVVEATSGNTGIALAMVCAAKGYPFVAVMADSFSIERRKLMRFLGAKVILTPAAERASGMVKKAEELAAAHGWFLTRQFDNPANPEYHRKTTGPEILHDFDGQRLDFWVTGYGTGGTLTGAGDVLKRARPDLTIVATEPEGAALLSGREWAPHKIQGWTPDFIASVLDRKLVDTIVTVSDLESRDAARELAAREGIFTGVSGGGTFAAARKVAETAPQGSVVLAMLPDTGERYLSTFLFEGINEGTDEV